MPKNVNDLRVKYPYIAPWNKRLGAFDAYIESQLIYAEEEGAPTNAIYRGQDGTWALADDVTNPDARADLGLPELPKAPLGLGDVINGGIIIAHRVLPGADGQGRWAVVLVFRRENVSQRFVVAQIPTGRHVTSWDSAGYFAVLSDAVIRFERGHPFP